MASLLVGIGSIALAIWGLNRWWGDFNLVMKGLLPVLLLLGGLVAVIAGASNLFPRHTNGSGDKPDPKL